MTGPRKIKDEREKEEQEEEKQTGLDEFVELQSLLTPEEFFKKILLEAEEGNTRAQHITWRMHHSIRDRTWIINYNGKKATIFDDAVLHWLETFAEQRHSYKRSYNVSPQN